MKAGLSMIAGMRYVDEIEGILAAWLSAPH
jgi:hypothetical protein